MDKALTWFIRIWVGLIVLLNVAAIIGFFATAPSFWAGIARVQETYSPFNVVNWIVEVISLSPALAAMWWRDKRRKNAVLAKKV